MEENSLWRIYQKNISTVEKSIQPVLLEILKSRDKTGMPVLSELNNIIMQRSKITRMAQDARSPRVRRVVSTWFSDFYILHAIANQRMQLT